MPPIFVVAELLVSNSNGGHGGGDGRGDGVGGGNLDYRATPGERLIAC